MIDQFMTALEADDLAESTRRAYVADVRAFLAWCGCESGNVATPTITAYRAHLLELKRKPTSINRAIISLKRYFAWLYQQRMILHDPAAAVKLLDQVTPPPRHLTDSEQARLVAAAQRSARDYALIVLMLHTGLRLAEVAALVTSDITIKARSGEIVVRNGKGRKRREIPLNVTARKALAPHLDVIEPGERVFAITTRGVNFLLGELSHTAKITPAVSAHDLRHAFAYRMAKSTPIDQLARMMGHTNVNTTMIYTMPTQQDNQAAVERIAWE